MKHINSVSGMLKQVYTEKIGFKDSSSIIPAGIEPGPLGYSVCC
jgi:hypothetical protein